VLHIYIDQERADDYLPPNRTAFCVHAAAPCTFWL